MLDCRRERLLEALDFFLKTGKQDGTHHWVRPDAFPRAIVWETQEGREAWEKSREKTDREGESSVTPPVRGIGRGLQ